MPVLLLWAPILLACPGTCAWYRWLRPTVGPEYERLERSLGSFDIRIRASEEYSQWLTGGLYEFESRRTGEEQWRAIMAFRHDDPYEIDPEWIVPFGDRVACVFAGWKCAVTPNAGATWNVWDAEADLPGFAEKEGGNYGYIRAVVILRTGFGFMKLSPLRWDSAGCLFTTDFGARWHRAGVGVGD